MDGEYETRPSAGNGGSSGTDSSDTSDALIQMRDIYKIFKTAAGDYEALRGISTEFYEGEFVGVVGRSGSGKSTLVNMLTGIDRPTSGEVWINGTRIHELSESKMAIWRGRNLGIVFQFYQLLPMLSLLENVMLPMDLAEVYEPQEREERAMQLLGLVDLEKEAHNLPGAVSGGQQQSAAIARALANDPPIIIADEPTGNLDSRSAELVFQIFEMLVEQGKTIVMVTHDNSLAQRASRTLLLSDGEVINETIAATLPLLSHSQMLTATKNQEPMQFQPGEMIVRQGEHIDYFYMITRGHIEIILTGPGGSKVRVARLGPGQFFGEVELLRSGKSIAGIRAGQESPVEVIALNREVFTQLMHEAETQRESLVRVVHERLAENQEMKKTLKRSPLSRWRSKE